MKIRQLNPTARRKTKKKRQSKLSAIARKIFSNCISSSKNTTKWRPSLSAASNFINESERELSEKCTS
jgi:hypothetical protein